MKELLKYFEDKSFVRWALKKEESSQNYWSNYIENNSEERENIELARILIHSLQSGKELHADDEAFLLFARIIREIEKRKKRNPGRIVFDLMKYAAVGILFFAMGIAIYRINHKPDRFEKLSELLVVQNNDDAQLILGNGNNVAISEKESNIEYNQSGEIIINRKDTLNNDNAAQTNELNQLIVPFGKSSSIKLPDGTVVFLNAGSRLVYPSFFNGKRREVFLFGEAYFEVEKNTDMPFVVQTNELEVVALGTKFNISAYPSDNIIETVLVEGKIGINENRFHLLSNEYILEPNQRATFNKEDNEIEITRVNVMNYVAWHYGYLYFEALDLSRVIRKIERYYRIQIRLEDPLIGLRKISGKLELIDDQESVLDVLAKTSSAELIKLNEATYVIK